MKLKKLEITGFKSFFEKATIQFPPGISAVVGPNGCGKSNVVDAIRWVMGEQSLKQLRGKSKEDIIFSGTNGRAALNMAEVSLTIANDNGSAPEELKDFTETTTIWSEDFEGVALGDSVNEQRAVSGAIPEPTTFIVWSLLGLSTIGMIRRQR